MLSKFNFNCDIYKQLKSNYEKKGTKEDLNNLRAYLDGKDIKLPKQLFKYNEEDISTWKYLDGSFYKNKSGGFRYHEVLNQDFKYK